jgi:hypothetical protein
MLYESDHLGSHGCCGVVLVQTNPGPAQAQLSWVTTVLQTVALGLGWAMQAGCCARPE